MTFIRVIAFAVAFSLSTPAYAIGPDIEHPYDYALHAAGGFLLADLLRRNTDWSDAAIVLAVIAVGITKEATDKNFDPIDAAAWVPGVFIRFTFEF